MSRPIRSPDGAAAARISHRGRPPEAAASLLIGEFGAAAALVVAGRELRSARMARSRLRFQFWAQVHETIDGRASPNAASSDGRPAQAAVLPR